MKKFESAFQSCHYRACPDNLDTRVKPEYDGKGVDISTPEYDGNKGLSTNILKHTLNVILGFIPRIHAKNSPLLDTRVRLFVTPEYDRNGVDISTPEYDRNGVDISTPEYGRERGLIKGLDVACQCAALLERLKTHIKINSLFCHPRAWLLARPEDLDSRVRLFVTPEYDGKMVKSIFPKKNDYNNIQTRCAPDATGFLSDVYKRNTRAQKTRALETAKSGVDKVVSSCEKNPNVHKTYMNFLRQRKTALDAPLHAISSGRSMIEMLGVLAIIGVLSVGGIAGYSKAMIKFKTNTLLQQISTIISNTQILYAQQKDHKGLNNETAIQMGVIPEELISSDGKTLVDSFGDEFAINEWSDGKEEHSIVFFLILRTTEKCLALANADWNALSSLLFIAFVSSDGDEFLTHCSDRYKNSIEISSECESSSGKIIKKLPFSPVDTVQICSFCSTEEPCILQLLAD